LSIEGLELRRMMSHVLEPVQLPIGGEAVQAYEAPAVLESAEGDVGGSADTEPGASVAGLFVDDSDFLGGTDAGILPGGCVVDQFPPRPIPGPIICFPPPHLPPITDVADATVAGRHVFYNNSAFDGGDPDANASDDEAIATDKTALLPGNTATFDNYTSYSRGINGIMVDIAGMDDPAGITTENVSDYFQLRVGSSDGRFEWCGTPYQNQWPFAPYDRGNTISDWGNAPAPNNVTVREGAGENGSDRVTITWPDNAIRDLWLEVRVLADGVGLEADDVFCFGNAVGEAGNSSRDAHVTATDLLLARNNQRSFLNPAPVDFNCDFNRDQRVNATDMLLARNNPTNFVTALRLVDLPDLEPDDPSTVDPPEPFPFPYPWPGGGIYW